MIDILEYVFVNKNDKQQVSVTLDGKVPNETTNTGAFDELRRRKPDFNDWVLVDVIDWHYPE